MSSTLVLLRHGQSLYNQKNIFTGFLDVELSEQGREEARRAGESLKDFKFDAVFTSALKRAADTAEIVLKDRMPADYFADAALNERHYGELQGQNKDEARALFGVEQVQIWRRSFDVRPNGGESLKDTCDRVLPFYKKNIEPRLKKGQCILVAAHGNSLRALVMHLQSLSATQIVGVEIPTGVPMVYEFDDNLKLINKKILSTKV